MRLKFVQSGGYAGLIKGCEIDTSTLKGSTVSSLHFLINIIRTNKKMNDIRSDIVDQFNYELEIVEGKKIFQITCNEESLPKELEPLITYLKKKSKPINP